MSGAGAGGPPPPPSSSVDSPGPSPPPLMESDTTSSTPADAAADTAADAASAAPDRPDELDITDLEAADSASDEEDEMDADLAKLRARQAAKAAKEREEKRNQVLQKLLHTNGPEFCRPEYLNFIPSLLTPGLLTGFRYEMTSPQLEEFVKGYKALKRVPLPETLTPQGLKVTPKTFHRHVGKRRYYRDLVRVFRTEFKDLFDEGQAELRAKCEGLSSGEANRLKRAAPPRYAWAVHRYLPLLMGGAAGGYFAGLVALAVALDNAINSYGNTNAMADALAYMAFTNAPVGKMRPPVPKQDLPPAPVEEPPLTPSSSRGGGVRGRAGDRSGGRASPVPVGGRGSVGGTPRTGRDSPGLGAGRSSSPLRSSPVKSRLGLGLGSVVYDGPGEQGTRTFLQVLAATREDKRLRSLFRKHSNVKSKYTKTPWGYPRSYHQRMRILSDKGQALLHEHFSTFQLYTVNFEDVNDPYFTGPPKAKYGPQTPPEALQRAVWELVDDIMHLYLSTAHPLYNDYYFLQMVKGAWALTRVLNMVGGLVEQYNLLMHFAKACMMMFIARGRPKFHPKVSAKNGSGGKGSSGGGGSGGGEESKSKSESKSNKLDPAAEMREKMEAQKRARLEAAAEKAAAEAELKAREALPPIPSWEGLLTKALEDATERSDPALLMLYRAVEDLAEFEDLQPPPWPPRDPAVEAERAAKAAAKLELLKKLGLPAAGLPEPLTTDEILRKLVFLSYTRPASFHAPA